MFAIRQCAGVSFKFNIIAHKRPLVKEEATRNNGNQNVMFHSDPFPEKWCSVFPAVGSIPPLTPRYDHCRYRDPRIEYIVTRITRKHRFSSTPLGRACVFIAVHVPSRCCVRRLAPVALSDGPSHASILDCLLFVYFCVSIPFTVFAVLFSLSLLVVTQIRGYI